jgi:hypothetical protein
MGRKIFISYKYGDVLVKDLSKKVIKVKEGKFHVTPRATRVRDYVDELQKIIGVDHINLGEKDGESLEDFSDLTIESNLKQKIFQSSITIVIISKGMKDASKKENEQWVPWEVSYSLRLVNREDRTSQMNAVLGVVIPDENGSYDWYYTNNPLCNCITHYTSKLFTILSSNMFNKKEREFRVCDGIKMNISNEPSFIKTFRWSDYINKAIQIKDNEDLYVIKTNLT